MAPQDFGFLDPDPQKYADPRIGFQGAKYQPKTATKNLLSNPKSELLKKERLQNFLISSQVLVKNKTKNLKILLK